MVRAQELPHEARLADAGLADDPHDLTSPRAGVPDRVGERGHFQLAARERGQAAGQGDLEPRAGARQPRELVHGHGLGEALDRHLAERRRLDMPLGEARDARRHEDGARPGELLHAAGEVRARADRGVVHGEAAADRADDDLPGIEADADARRDAPARVQLAPVALERLLHAQGGVTGADGVVLERHRRAEQRHDAVAHHLVHRALVLAHGVHHQG